MSVNWENLPSTNTPLNASNLKKILKWDLIETHTNTGSSETTKTVTISNINDYSEILVTVGQATANTRVLASNVIPSDILAGVQTGGQHQVIYYASASTIFRGGISFNSSTNVMTIYAGSNSGIRVYAR